MRRWSSFILLVVGSALIAWALWIRLQLGVVDGGGIARLRRVGATLTGRDGDIARWQQQAIIAALVGPSFVLLAWIVSRSAGTDDRRKPDDERSPRPASRRKR